MGTAYFDARSVTLRLDRTICIYKGMPVFVEAGNRREDWHNVTIHALPVGSTKGNIVDYREPEFDYRAFPLGYINYSGGTAHYLMRVPSRQQAQGLSRGCIISSPELRSEGGWFRSQEMSDCILGKYPTLSECVDTIKTYKRRSTAFTRELSLEEDAGTILLQYKGRNIGYQEGDKYKLFPSRDRKMLRSIIEGQAGICLY